MSQSTASIAEPINVDDIREASFLRDASAAFRQNRLAISGLLFVILVMSMLGAGLMNIFIAIGFTGWVGIARQTRAQVLSIKEKEFVEGARALGAGFFRQVTRHILPSALTPIVVSVTFGRVTVIVL